MEHQLEMCICGWIGISFQSHHEDIRLEDNVHAQTSPMMQFALRDLFHKG